MSRAKETLAPNHENEIVGDINSIEGKFITPKRITSAPPSTSRAIPLQPKHDCT